MTNSGPMWSGISNLQNFGSQPNFWNAPLQNGVHSAGAGGFQDAALQFGLWMQAQLQQAFMAGYQAGQQASQLTNSASFGNGPGNGAWNHFGAGPAWGQGWQQHQPTQLGPVLTGHFSSVPSPLSSLFTNSVTGESGGRTSPVNRDAA